MLRAVPSLVRRLSIVTTLYRSAPFVQEFFDRTMAAVSPFADEVEVVFVDDGSPDDSLELARALIGSSGADVKVVELSRNFGHFPAIMTGLDHATGDIMFLLDSDLEEAPELFAELFEPIATAPADDPVDMVFGVARRREGGLVRRIGGGLFWWLIDALSRVPIPANAVMARVMTRRFVDSLLEHRERELFLTGVMTLTGYRQIAIPVDKPGKDTSTYSLLHRMSVALQAVTAFSDKPLTIIFFTGISLSVVSALVGAYIVFTALVLGVDYLSGWTSLLATMCFLSGLMLASLGVLGFYLGRVFVEVKGRPVIVKRVHTAAPQGEPASGVPAALEHRVGVGHPQ
jgi:putative glycosyltransferase